ncbi:uncharacterized protein LOC122075965 [Macadamia integrifolia]|uniref:uncharacterized protein LOC122075965 n=1 Tax=Macadamia integrifolia TaxID=60698 RepID=UPI001C4F70DB|nr:uncharacterized protein LOC122075965 [Macadamia integrifolia]
MKREGRQHGMVRLHIAGIPFVYGPIRSAKVFTQFESPVTAGNFMKVSSKPTNHSKFTGKCGRSRCNGCHSHPVSKSKDKAKGTHKEKAFGGRNGGCLNYAGLSATAFLGQLATRDAQDYDDYDEEEPEEEKQMEMGYGDDVYYQNDYCSNDNVEDIAAPALTAGGIEEIVHEPEEEQEDEDENDDGDDDDDTMSVMSFLEVGFVMELEEEGWFVVEEM